MAKHHIRKILEDVGRDVLISDLGIPERTIDHALYAGYFSGLHYGPIKQYCDKHQIFLSMDAFKWKAPKKVGKRRKGNQDIAAEKVNPQAGAA